MSKWKEFKWSVSERWDSFTYWLSDLWSGFVDLVKQLIVGLCALAAMLVFVTLGAYLYKAGLLWYVLGGLTLIGLIASPFVVFWRMKKQVRRLKDDLGLSRRETEDAEAALEKSKVELRRERVKADTNESATVKFLKSRIEELAGEETQLERRISNKEMELRVLRALGGFENLCLRALHGDRKHSLAGMQFLYEKIVRGHEESGIENILLAEDLFNAVVSRLVSLGIPVCTDSFNFNVDGKKEADEVACLKEGNGEYIYYLRPGERSQLSAGRSFSLAFRIVKAETSKKSQITIFPVSWEKRRAPASHAVA